MNWNIGILLSKDGGASFEKTETTGQKKSITYAFKAKYLYLTGKLTISKSEKPFLPGVQILADSGYQGL